MSTIWHLSRRRSRVATRTNAPGRGIGRAIPYCVIIASMRLRICSICFCMSASLGGAAFYGLVWAFPVRWMNERFVSDLKD